MERSVLGFLGPAALVFGGLILLLVWLFIPIIPPPLEPSEAALAEIIGAEDRTPILLLRQDLWWFGETLLKGGFFMWITALLLDRMARSPVGGGT
jgi:hypothetical protein